MLNWFDNWFAFNKKMAGSGLAKTKDIGRNLMEIDFCIAPNFGPRSFFLPWAVVDSETHNW